MAPEGVLCGSGLPVAAIGSGLWPHGLISASQKLCKLRGGARATLVEVAIGLLVSQALFFFTFLLVLLCPIFFFFCPTYFFCLLFFLLLTFPHSVGWTEHWNDSGCFLVAFYHSVAVLSNFLFGPVSKILFIGFYT